MITVGVNLFILIYNKMDKEEFLKSKFKKIAYNHNINIKSPVVFKEIITDLLDIYNEAYDKGYDDGYRDWY